MNKEVPIEKAKFVVFIDFAESDMEGYANYEDAKEALEARQTAMGYGGKWRHYLAEVKEFIDIDHDE